MSHGVEGHTRRGPLTSDDAELVAEVMQALATPSRVLIRAQLRESSLSVSELVAGAAVLALSLPAGAWAGPQALAAGAPEEAGCSWGIKSNPDTVNIAYPDLDVTYWAHEFVPVPGERLVIKGAYPAARYFSFHVYDSRAFPLDSAFDARIAPDPGSSNPFL